jgi:hypothetical protein
MKILINGYTVTEHMQLVRSRKDLDLVNKAIDHIKANKGMYLKLVLLTALMLHFDILIYADSFGDSLDRVGNQILGMLESVAKWGCLSMGVKDMITTLLNGGSMKNAINSGLIYLLGYVFISLYPQLFSLFSGIRF